MLVQKFNPQKKLPENRVEEEDIMSSKGHKTNRLGYKLLGVFARILPNSNYF